MLQSNVVNKFGLFDETLGLLPKTFEIYLGGGSFECFEVHKYWAWYQFKKNEYN